MAYMGVQQTYGGIARVVIPLWAGFSYDHFGKGVPFITSSILVLGSLFLGLGVDDGRKVKAQPEPVEVAEEEAVEFDFGARAGTRQHQGRGERDHRGDDVQGEGNRHGFPVAQAVDDEAEENDRDREREHVPGGEAPRHLQEHALRKAGSGGAFGC